MLIWNLLEDLFTVALPTAVKSFPERFILTYKLHSKGQHLYMMVNLCCGQSITYVPVGKRNMKFPWNEEGSVGAIHRTLSVRKVMGRDL